MYFCYIGKLTVRIHHCNTIRDFFFKFQLTFYDYPKCLLTDYLYYYMVFILYFLYVKIFDL